ncbi:MAG: purine-nucleoside phosphorylase [Myxococcales bacterium]|nr:purine-nucleoside phosphorylase [Myxococcales bacterium]
MPNKDLSARLSEARDAIFKRIDIQPEVGLVLGSGLGAFADSLSNATSFSFDEIPNMPRPSVSGHAGRLVVGTVSDVPVAVLQGRVHLYEGHSPDAAVFGVRLLAKLGVFAVLLSNAAGGIRTSFKPGTLMLIRDHINLSGINPLVGANDDELGPRFPDMTRAYDPRLRSLARDAAADIGFHLEEGVYTAMLGPSYETPAEIRMLRTLGADAVGMSTVPEVIALQHMGVRTAAVSCITNMAAGMTGEVLHHSEVEQTAESVRETFVKLFHAWIERIGAADWASTTGRFRAKK